LATISSEKFLEICNGVWCDRAAIVRGRGFLSEEAALVRAVYWRLCKFGGTPTVSAENYGSLQTVSAYQLGVSCLLELNGRPCFDGAPYLQELVDRYKNELGQNC
jgi:hypothetical protein